MNLKIHTRMLALAFRTNLPPASRIITGYLLFRYANHVPSSRQEITGDNYIKLRKFNQIVTNCRTQKFHISGPVLRKTGSQKSIFPDTSGWQILAVAGKIIFWSGEPP